MSMTSSTFLALAIFPPAPTVDRPGDAATSLPADEHEAAVLPPVFPPAFLAFLGAVFLVAPGDPAATESRVSVSLGLLLASLVWVSLLRVLDLHAAPLVPPAEQPS